MMASGAEASTLWAWDRVFCVSTRSDAPAPVRVLLVMAGDFCATRDDRARVTLVAGPLQSGHKPAEV